MDPNAFRMVNPAVRTLLPFCMLAPVLLGTASPPGADWKGAVVQPERASLAAERDAAAADLLFAPEIAAAPVAAAVAPPPPPSPAPPSEPAPPPPAAPVAAPEPPPAVAPAKAKRPGVRILVSLPQQKLYAFRGDKVLMTSPVSTGKRGHETPAGTFPILQKKVRHRSSTYDNAPMPYMQRLTWSGVALHAGALPGYPASHGCIRLPRKAAKKLFGHTNFDTIVTITHDKPRSADAALDLLNG